MRAITPVFSVLLILILSVALVTFFWLFTTGTFNILKLTGTSTVDESLLTISSCMKIESVSGNQVSIRNCGKGSITQGTLGAYLDDIPLNVTMSPTIINEDEVGLVSLSGLWNFGLGRHTLRVANPRVVTETPVNAVLPDSCVMDLEFDEGQGTDAFDGSGNNNTGILYNDSIHSSPGGGPAIRCSDPPIVGCPKWVYGKHGKALKFDADYDYVEVLDSTTLDSLAYTKQVTWSFWFKFESFIFPYNSPTLLGKNFTDPNKEYNIRFNYNIASPSFKKISVTLANEISTEFFSPDKTDWQIGEWYHVTINYINTTNIAKAFINGVFNGSTTFTLNNLLKDNPSPLLIGISFQAMGFNGTMDEVRIYNQTLTPDQLIYLRPVSYD